MVITNQALNTSSSRGLGKASQTCSNHGQDREKGLKLNTTDSEMEKKKKKKERHSALFGAPLPGVLFLLPQKLSYIPHLSAYFTYLGKVSSLSLLQSISDNHVAHMLQEKPALCLLDFFPLSGIKRKKISRFSLLLLFPIMIWIANISIPTSSPLVAPGPFLEDQQTADPFSSHQPERKQIATYSPWESGFRP